MIFYFTGTGNSLYIARKIAESLNDEVCSIPQILVDDPREQIVCDDDVIGIVYPTYAFDAPEIIHKFIEKSKLHPKYGFMIATYGTWDGGVSYWAAEFAKAHGFDVDYSNCINMIDNWLPEYDADLQRAMDKNVEGQLESILEDLLARRQFIPNTTEKDIAQHDKNAEMGPKPTAFDTFNVNDDCTSCGTCELVCPTATITLPKGQPVWDNQECLWCFACINLCPEKAIGFKSLPDANRNARYRNEHITVADIIVSNNQRD